MRTNYWKPNRADELSQLEYNTLRQSIRNRLKDYSLTQVWLIRQLRLACVPTEKAELSAVFSGTRYGAKIDAILREADAILTRYENDFEKRKRDE